MGTPASEKPQIHAQTAINSRKNPLSDADRWVGNLRRLAEKQIDGWVRLRVINDCSRVSSAKAMSIVGTLEDAGVIESRKAPDKTPGRSALEVRLTAGVTL